MSELYVHCSMCGDKLTGEFFTCHYANEWNENDRLCGEGDCWSEWFHSNYTTHEITEHLAENDPNEEED